MKDSQYLGLYAVIEKMETLALYMKDLQLGLHTIKNEMVRYQYCGTNEMIKG